MYENEEWYIFGAKIQILFQSLNTSDDFLETNLRFFFSMLRMTFQPLKSESFDDEPLKKPLKTVLMLDYVHYQWRQNLSVRLLLSAMILAREPPIITLDKKMGPSTYLLHSTFPHSMHKKRFE